MYKSLGWKLPNEVVPPEDFDQCITTNNKTSDELGFIPPPRITFVKNRILYMDSSINNALTENPEYKFGPKLKKLYEWAHQTNTPYPIVHSYVGDLIKTPSVIHLENWDVKMLLFLLPPELCHIFHKYYQFIKRYTQNIYLQTGPYMCLRHTYKIVTTLVVICPVEKDYYLGKIPIKIYDNIAYINNVNNWFSRRFKSPIENERFYDLFLYYLFDNNLSITFPIRFN